MALKRRIVESKENREAKIALWKKRPMSWSQYSQFTQYSKFDWFNKYINGGETTPSKEMRFGSFVDKKIQDDPTFIPDLKREVSLQYKMHCPLSDFHLIGIPDAIDLEKKVLRDYKTGKQNWTQSRADSTGQLTWYLLMVYLIHQVDPSEYECYIDWLETMEDPEGNIMLKQPAVPQVFKTKRNKKDILVLASEIINIRKEMEDFARSYAQ
jgi:hypothetical protein